MSEIRRLTMLSPAAFGPLVGSSAAEGFRFVARLVAEWDTGALRFDRPGEALVGCFDHERLVGVGGLTRDPHRSPPTVGRLRHLYVLPEMRRRGWGTRLVQALEAHAAGTYSELVLRTETAAAARFYEALGYRRLPTGGTATHHRSFGELT